MRSMSIPQKPRIFSKYKSPQRSCSPGVTEAHIYTQQTAINTKDYAIVEGACRVLANPLQYSSEKPKHDQAIPVARNFQTGLETAVNPPQPRPSSSFIAENLSANSNLQRTFTTDTSEFNVKDKDETSRMSLNDIKKFLNNSGILSRGENKLERNPMPFCEGYLNVKAHNGPIPVKLVPDTPTNRFDVLDSFRCSIDDMSRKSGRVLQNVSTNCSNSLKSSNSAIVNQDSEANRKRNGLSEFGLTFEINSLDGGSSYQKQIVKPTGVYDSMNSFRAKNNEELKNVCKTDEENFDPSLKKGLKNSFEDNPGFRKRINSSEIRASNIFTSDKKNQDFPLQANFKTEKRLKKWNRFDELVKNCIHRSEEALKMIAIDDAEKGCQQRPQLTLNLDLDIGLTFNQDLLSVSKRLDYAPSEVMTYEQSSQIKKHRNSIDPKALIKPTQAPEKSIMIRGNHQRTSSMGALVQSPDFSMGNSKNKIDEIFNTAMKRSQSILSRLQVKPEKLKNGGLGQGQDGLSQGNRYESAASSYRPPLSSGKQNITPHRQRNSEYIRQSSPSPDKRSPIRTSSPARNQNSSRNSPNLSPCISGKTSRCTSGLIARYEGDKKGSMRDGSGKAFYSSGELYEGFWKNDKREGFGKFKNRLGAEVYLGDWENDMFHGQGVERNENVRAVNTVDYKCLINLQEIYERYEGEFREGRKDGIGTLYFSNGEKYVGKISKGVVHGEGTFHSHEDGIVMGLWDQGKLKKVF